MLNALSFDVEEWFDAELLRRLIPPAQRLSRVRAATDRILDLLSRRRLRATFFIVGEVALAHPDLVGTLVAEGHEVGCHGMTHRPLWEHTAESLAADVRAFRQVVGDAADVIGYRAPTFSLRQGTAWALQTLSDAGFLYDSSLFPVANYMYGVNGGPLGAYRPSLSDLTQEDAAGPIVELPMTAWQAGAMRLPVSGGFYLRALPTTLLRYALRRVARCRPIVLYLHPWEADIETPIVGGLKPVEHFITYHGREKTLARLESLLDEFAFAPIREVLDRPATVAAASGSEALR